MLGSSILEVAIGIFFVYALVAVVCSTVREGLEAWRKSRAAYLEYGIRELLHDTPGTGLARSLFTHPLISGLYAGSYPRGAPEPDEQAPAPHASARRPSALTSGGDLPSYIPASNFALALMDITARGTETDAFSADVHAPAISLDALRQNLWNLENTHVQRALLVAIDAAQGDLARAQTNIQAWYDSAMDRVSGWYKRSTQRLLFVIALLVTLALNVNTITIAEHLYRDDVLRAAAVASADAARRDPAQPDGGGQAARAHLNALALPIGWDAGWGAPRRGDEVGSSGPWNDWFAPVLGWLLTAFAATLGAPFWFDVLNKVMVIRSTVKPHEKSPEEASEDRQHPLRPEREGLHLVRAAPRGEGGGGMAGAPHVTAHVTARGAAPVDAYSRVDGCADTVGAETTRDDDLPAAEGGVA